MSGILCAIRLREEGYRDITIYEKAHTLGGTWRENRYPGLSCDIPSHVYSYSFEPNPNWSHKYSPGPEIQAYFDSVAHRHDVQSLMRFNTEITSCEYADGQWRLESHGSHCGSAHVVLAATGILHHPKVPHFEGIESFRGPSFHTARWPDAEDVPLDGKRVGIIGTGSTAVQIVTAIVDQVEAVTLFQRTAQWIWPEANAPYSEADQARFRDTPGSLAHIRGRMSDMIDSRFSNALVAADSDAMQALENECRVNLERNIQDAELREKLTPDYRAGCKRLIMSAGFYESIQQPNADLVTEAIAGIEEAGVKTSDGTLHELDVLVLATGFDAHQFMRPMRVTGRDGVELADVWSESVFAYRSISIPDFPNFFMLMGPQSPVGNFSLIDVAEIQFNYIEQLMSWIRDGQCDAVSATHEATERFTDDVMGAMKHTIWVTGCNSWYLDDRGVPITWPWTVQDFAHSMRQAVREDYDLEVV
ncbi:MAG: NAD(P)/FAD-dependent oxidoreductase [Chromatiales bacterium]|nr:NAD(P)/FAD-dependent oxidoreductase [Chromatiales bacterium]